MIIVHVITRWLKAGSEENTLQTCRAQRAQGHRVVLVYGVERDPASVARASEQVEAVCLPSLVHAISPAADLKAISELRKLFISLGADVVHTHQSKAGVLARLAARLAGVPVIIHGVHILPWMHVGRLERQIYLAAERACALLTDAYVNVSPGVRDEGVSRGVGAAARHFVAYSAMDVARFRSAQPPDDWRTLLGVGPGQPKPLTVLMLAAFEPRKRHGELIAALAAGLSARPSLRLLLGGEGPVLAEARAQVERLGLGSQVVFAGHRSDPERLVALADICVLSSAREGLPRVVVQYAAAGKAIVLTRLPGIEDVVTPGVSALVTDTVEETGAAVLDLADDPVRRAALASGASEVDVERWSPERMQADMDRAYASGVARAQRLRRPRARTLVANTA